MPLFHRIGKYLIRTIFASTVTSSLTLAILLTRFPTLDELRMKNFYVEDLSADSIAPASMNGSMTLSKVQKRRILEDLLDEKKPLSSVCRSIADTTYIIDTELNAGQYTGNLIASFEPGVSLPYSECIKPLVRFCTNMPAAKSMLKDLLAPPSYDNNGLIGKAKYYFRLEEVRSELWAQRKDIEALLDKSYLLLMLTKTISKKPELREDPRFMDYCESLEAPINGPVTYNFAGAKQNFSEFLKQRRIDPELIGFDEDYETHLNINFPQHRIHFEGGWLNQVFRQGPPHQTQ